MKNFKYTSFGKEYYFDTLDELHTYVLSNKIDESLTLYQRDVNTSSYTEIGEIKDWIKQQNKNPKYMLLPTELMHLQDYAYSARKIRKGLYAFDIPQWKKMVV